MNRPKKGRVLSADRPKRTFEAFFLTKIHLKILEKMAKIEVLKRLLAAAGNINDTIGSALADDGKISGMGEWFDVMTAGVKHWRVASEFNFLFSEIIDIDAAERAELTAHFANVWKLPKPVAEKRWEAAFKWLVSTAEFYRDWTVAPNAAA